MNLYQRLESLVLKVDLDGDDLKLKIQEHQQQLLHHHSNLHHRYQIHFSEKEGREEGILCDDMSAQCHSEGRRIVIAIFLLKGKDIKAVH